jgi:hypothetical protein
MEVFNSKEKMDYKILFFVLFNFNGLTYGQKTGTCKDNLGNPVSYANISIKDKTYGTVTDAEGNFYLESTEVSEKDSLIISHINFEKQVVSFPSDGNLSIVMKPADIILDEVIVTNRGVSNKRKLIGTKTKSDNVILSFVSNNLGNEVGKIIKVKKDMVYNIKKVFFNVTDLDYDSVIVRVNFYSIENEIINRFRDNNSEILLEIKEEGMVEINLEEQYLSFHSDFLVSIEWIDFKPKNKTSTKDNLFYISSTVFSGPFVFRENVNLSWNVQKVKYNSGLGIHLLVSY